MATKTPKKPAPIRMTREVKKAIEEAAEKIERARVVAGESKQPKFSMSAKQANSIFEKIYKFGKDAIFMEPKYMSDSRKRDTWLANAIMQEPYLLGILQSVVSIDKNRGWTLIGGRNQVRRFVAILHNFGVAPDLFGWRNGISATARSYYQSDLGGVVEIGRTMENGPLAALFTVDPTQCSLTGNLDTPLKYWPAPKGNQLWSLSDYFRVTSFPSTAEKMNGLGYCAGSRCLELAKLLVSLFDHEKEQLGSKAPKGILTINNVTQDQWLNAIDQSDEERAVAMRQLYSGVAVLANGDSGKDISVDLTSLSVLPEQFNRQDFLDAVIYGYALAFGYDPREFWPVSSGSLGNNIETESQHRRATSKGGLDFALAFQENIQEELPPTVEFEFEQRDVAGDLAETEFKMAQLDVIKGMFESVNQGGQNLISYEEARQLLVTAKLIPDDWTPEDEAQQIADTDDAGTQVDEALLEKARVREAIAKFPSEHIVEYNERTGKTRTIYDPMKKRFVIRNVKPKRNEIVGLTEAINNMSATQVSPK